MQAKADAKARGKEEERLRKAVELRDSRLATLVADKQRLSEEAEQRQREVRRHCLLCFLRAWTASLQPSRSRPFGKMRQHRKEWPKTHKDRQSGISQMA